MLEQGHFLAGQEAKIRAQEAISEGRVEDAVIAIKQQIAVERIRTFTVSVLEELNIPDIEPRGLALNSPPEYDENLAEEIRNMPLGGAIRFFRTQLGMSQADLSHTSHVSTGHIRHTEHGMFRSTGLNTVLNLIRGFGWSEEDWRAQLLLEKQRVMRRTQMPQS